MRHTNQVMVSLQLLMLAVSANVAASSDGCIICINGKVMFPFDVAGPSQRSPDAEVCDNRKLLTQLTAENVPPDVMEGGGILLDGTIQMVRIQPNRRQEISVQVSKVLFGDIGLSEQITIISPFEADGGISVVIGEPYRLFAMRSGASYYTWALTGSAPIARLFSDSYGCDESGKE